MAVKTKAQILSEISTLLADNTTGDISANDVRTVVNDITDSYEDLITAGNTSQYWRGDKTWQTLPLLEATGSLTSAQINALDTTPLQLIPAPGANKYILIENTSFHYKAGTTGFTFPGEFAISIYYTSSEEAIMSSIGSNAPIDQSTLTNIVSKIKNSYPPPTTFSTNIINDSVSLGSGTISGGNGTINYSIKYRIVTTS